MDKLLIIVTDKDDHDMFSIFGAAGYMTVEGLDDVLHKNGEGYKTYVISKKESPGETTTIVTNLINQNQSSETLVCSHAGYMEENDIVPIHFSHQENDDIGKLLIDLSNGEDTKKTFELLIKKKCKYLIFDILSIFLPLDIDMQALEILSERAATKGPDEYLGEMLSEGIGYAGKNTELEEKIKALMKYRSIPAERFRALKGVVAPFLEILRTQADNNNADYSALTVYWETTEYQSFHEWYCDLSDYLWNTITCKPRLKDLQSIVALYFKRNPPAVKWRQMEYAGLADRKEHTIYLNPNMSPGGHDSIGAGGVTLIYKSGLKLAEGEQYFLTLLHEIGHFKIESKAPKQYLILKERLEKMWPNNITMQHYSAEVPRKKGESDEEHLGRLEDFRSWLIGDRISEHDKVEGWAREEFKKIRRRIRELLKTRNE